MSNKGRQFFSGENKQGWHCRTSRDGDDQKKSPVFFQEKIGVTPSVASPGDTQPNDVTVPTRSIYIEKKRKKQYTETR